MTSAQRLAEGYEPSFDIDYEVGRQGELFVSRVIDSLTGGSASIEVKTDERVAQTGRVYIEYACQRRGRYEWSGIATTRADLWAFVLPANVLIVAPVESVRALVRRRWQNRAECSRGSHPTRGVVVPVGLFVRELYEFEVAASP